MESTGTIDNLLIHPNTTLDDIITDEEFDIELSNNNEKLIKLYLYKKPCHS